MSAVAGKSSPKRAGSATEISSRSSETRNFVKGAIKAQKIFLVHPWFPAVKAALVKRGWVEKVCKLPPRPSSLNQVVPSDQELIIDKRSISDFADQAWTERLLQEYAPNFMWLFNQNFDCRILNPGQMVNMHPQQHIALKVDLVGCMQSMQWYTKIPLAHTLMPRAYRLGIEEEKLAFIQDFRMTACISLLSWLVERYENKGINGLMDDAGMVSVKCVDFARTNIEQFLLTKNHEDLDWICEPQPLTRIMSWEKFIDSYMELAKGKTCFATAGDPKSSCARLYDVAVNTLNAIEPYWSQLSIDGYRNIWICKPGKGSRGDGIVLFNELPKILSLPPREHESNRELHWVVQKYIERPLLIYETKFDIRQWFLVTSFSPLTVWFYKESYLKFTSRQFSLEDLGACIHLCNYAVQKRFENATTRHSGLPEDNMWDSAMFKKHLEETYGTGRFWDDRIYPSMKQLIMGVLLARQDEMEVRKSSFQLYGADIMIVEDFTPWLIEVNSFPSMELSSAVCARLCPQVMEDTIKVVLDRKFNEKAKTGSFELIYKPKVAPRIAQRKPSTAEVGIVCQHVSWDIDWPWSNRPTRRPMKRFSTISVLDAIPSKMQQSRSSTPKCSRSRAASAKSSESNLSTIPSQNVRSSRSQKRVTRPSKSTGELLSTNGMKCLVVTAPLATNSQVLQASRKRLEKRKSTIRSAESSRSRASVRQSAVRASTVSFKNGSDITNNNNNSNRRSKSILKVSNSKSKDAASAAKLK